MPKSIKKLNRSKLVLSILFLSIFWLFAPKRVNAITIPTRVDLSGDPGQTLEHKLEIFNEEDRAITFYITKQNFEARGETGSPYHLPYDGTGLASWIFSVDSISLGPKERAELNYEVVIPQDAEAGGYFASVFFGTNPPVTDEAGQVTVGSKTGTLIFLDVSGDAPEGAGIIEFNSKDGGTFTHLPLTLYYRFSNDGGRKVMPLGNIEIKNMLGSKTADLDANVSKGNVLPGSIRRFEIDWNTLGQDTVNEEVEKPESVMALEEGQKLSFFDIVKIQKDNFAIGKYTADLNLKYGDNETSSAQTSFWVIPWQLLSLVAGALLLIIIIIKLMMRGHNKKLIEQVKKETLASQQVTIAPTKDTEVVEETKSEPTVTKEQAESVISGEPTVQEEQGEEPQEETKPEAINPKE